VDVIVVEVILGQIRKRSEMRFVYPSEQQRQGGNTAWVGEKTNKTKQKS
jgi:hypothetical protein